MTPHYEDRAVTLWHGDCLDVLRQLPDSSVDSVVTDPPYGLEFMGKEWDAPWKQAGTVLHDPSEVGGFQDGNGGNAYSRSRIRYGRGEADSVAFQRWCEQWAAECLRVLKPGGHLLAFGGTRTWHRLACAVEDAGFEVRDSLAWLYGSGFPKSLDVSKAIDKANGRNFEDRYALGRHIRERRQALGLTQAEVNSWFGYRDGCQHWERQDPSGARVPTLADYAVLRDRLGLSDDYLELVKRVEAEREVIGTGSSGAAAVAFARAAAGDYDVTAPSTDAARQWQGWGTAMKPAFEPVVVARKPLAGTVAANVLAHGTGALNIDGCRVESGGEAIAAHHGTKGGDIGFTAGGSGGYKPGDAATTPPNTAGRWPANVLLDGSQADELDRQSGVSTSPGTYVRSTVVENHVYGASNDRPVQHGHGDSGGASRFFPVFRSGLDDEPTDVRPPCTRRYGHDGPCTNVPPASRATFRYQAKAPTRERPRGDDGTAHPTVKPLDLMRWLVRLVTPPGGVVLEPFAGSGTTVEAAILEGFRCVAVEREATYLPLIEQRIRRVTVDPPEPPATAAPVEVHQPDLFGGAA